MVICVEIDYGSDTTVKNNNITSPSGNLTDFGTLADIEAQDFVGPATISANLVGGGVRYSVRVNYSPYGDHHRQQCDG